MKIRRSQNKEAQKFWGNMEQVQKNVEKWPSWKRNVQLTNYSSQFVKEKITASEADRRDTQ